MLHVRAIVEMPEPKTSDVRSSIHMPLIPCITYYGHLVSLQAHHTHRRHETTILSSIALITRGTSTHRMIRHRLAAPSALTVQPAMISTSRCRTCQFQVSMSTQSSLPEHRALLAVPPARHVMKLRTSTLPPVIIHPRCSCSLRPAT